MIIDSEFVVLLYVFCSVNASAVSVNVNSIPVFTSTNFKKQKQYVMITLGCMDLDLAIQIEPLAALIDTSTTQQKVYYVR